MAINGTGSLVILLIVFLAALTFQTQVEGKPQYNFHPDKEDNVSRIIDHSNSDMLPEKAERGQFPWQVLLKMVELDDIQFETVELDDIHTECGGSIIDQKWVMTSAHCLVENVVDKDNNANGYTFNKESLSIFAGAIDKTFPVLLTEINDQLVQFWSYKSEDFTATGDDKKVFIHNKYNKGKAYRNDIALIKLNRPLTLTEYVMPIQLATVNNFNPDENDFKPDETPLTVSGWGDTSDNGNSPDDLRFVKGLILQSDKRCKEMFDNFEKDTEICHETENKNSLEGDSGGPVIFEIKPKGSSIYVQIGIVSWGIKTEKWADVYTNVAKFSTWIDSTMCWSPDIQVCELDQIAIFTRSGSKRCVPISTSCPDDGDYFTLTVGGPKQCFKVLKQSATWEQANKDCMDLNLKLAQPFAPVQLRSYIVQEYGSDFYVWLGACQEEPNKMMWKVGGEEITKEDPLWYPGQPNYHEGCLLLLTSETYWQKEPEKPFWNVKSTYEFYPLCELVLA